MLKDYQGFCNWILAWAFNRLSRQYQIFDISLRNLILHKTDVGEKSKGNMPNK